MFKNIINNLTNKLNTIKEENEQYQKLLEEATTLTNCLIVFLQYKYFVHYTINKKIRY